MREHSQLKKWYQDTVTQSVDSRTQAERDRDYYDGKQWTADEEAELAKRKQPVITVNRIKPKIDGLVGLEIQGRVDIKAFPRNPQDEETAEVATDALRYVADNSDFDQTKTECAKHLFIEGTMAAMMEVKETKTGIDIIPAVIPWDRFFIDSHSTKLDGSDAKFMGQALWMDSEDAQALFPEADPSVITAGLEDGGGADTYDDKPRDIFYDQGRDRVKIIQMFYLSKGKWHESFFTGLGKLQPCKLSGYLDEEDEPMNPIVCHRAFLDRDNNPYGVVRQMISIQDEINKRRSKSLHLLSVRQVIADEGAVDNVPLAKRELNKPDGWVTKNPGKEIQVQQTSDLASGQINLLQEAKGEIDAIGANAAVTGKEERNLSGRALQVRQQAGVVELAIVLDGLRSWEKRCYRQIWMRIKQFWNEEKYIRVTDDEKNVKFVALNKPVTYREKFDQAQQPYDALQPGLNEVAEVQNQVAELDVDIILEAVPDQVNLQAEQFELLAGMYQANPESIPFDMIIEASSLRGKDRILEKLNGGGDLTPEQQQQAQAEQEAQQAAQQKQEQMADIMFQLEAEEKQTNIQKTKVQMKAEQARAMKDMAEAEAQDLENDATESGLVEIMEQLSNVSN